MRNFVFSVLAASLLAGCATQDGNSSMNGFDPSSDMRVGEAEDRICFKERSSGFYPLGDNAIVLQRINGASYLAMTGFCPNVDNVRSVSPIRYCRMRGLDDRCLEWREPMTCVRRGDEFFVFDTEFPTDRDFESRASRCRLTGLHRFNKEVSQDAILD